MNRITALVAIFSIVSFVSLFPLPALSQEKPPTWEVYFPPNGGLHRVKEIMRWN